jgi:hypothetical protein
MTVVKMMETLPDTAQSQVVEYVKNYISDLTRRIALG